jgi:two-component system response regulator AlgR
MIVDDEPLAIERLTLLLARCQGVMLVGTAPDGEAALRIAEAVVPQVMLLDIAMPGMDGIEVARALGRSSIDPVVIFVTAFDNFAVAAFDVAAADYLMKPVDGERLARALERARDAIDKGRGQRAAPVTLRPGILGSRPARPRPHRRAGHRPDIRGARLYAAPRRREELAHLPHDRQAREELDPELFIRVHRSVILRRDTIVGLTRDSAGHWAARLKDGCEVRIGRSHIGDVKKLAGRA